MMVIGSHAFHGIRRCNLSCSRKYFFALSGFAADNGRRGGSPQKGVVSRTEPWKAGERETRRRREPWTANKPSFGGESHSATSAVLRNYGVGKREGRFSQTSGQVLTAGGLCGEPAAGELNDNFLPVVSLDKYHAVLGGSPGAAELFERRT